MKTAGIDGCKIGWILTTFTEGEAKYQIIDNNDELVAASNITTVFSLICLLD